MAEMLNVRVMETGEERTIADVVPTESAELYWQISDGIWRRKPAELKLACYRMPSIMPTLEARDALNEVFTDIDEELVVSGIGKAVKLAGSHPFGEVEFSPELLDNPAGSHVGTFNWDQRNTWRPADIDGREGVVEFTDDHKDKHRELFAGFDYRDDKRRIVELIYSMQRMQYKQDHPTYLLMRIWYSEFADIGYEGDHLKRVLLSVEQELKVLGVFQAMGGVALEASK